MYLPYYLKMYLPYYLKIPLPDHLKYLSLITWIAAYVSYLCYWISYPWLLLWAWLSTVIYIRGQARHFFGGTLNTFSRKRPIIIPITFFLLFNPWPHFYVSLTTTTTTSSSIYGSLSLLLPLSITWCYFGSLVYIRGLYYYLFLRVGYCCYLWIRTTWIISLLGCLYYDCSGYGYLFTRVLS